MPEEVTSEEVQGEVEYMGDKFPLCLRPGPSDGTFSWVLDDPGGNLLTIGPSARDMGEAQALAKAYLRGLWPFGRSHTLGESDTARQIEVGSDTYLVLLSSDGHGRFNWVLYNPDGAPIAFGRETVGGMDGAAALARAYLTP